MMYDGTRCQQHCKTLFHVIGYYSHNIEATFRIKKNEDYIKVLRNISIKRRAD